MRISIAFFRNSLTIATLILTLSAINAAAATFTVTKTNDSGAGSFIARAGSRVVEMCKESKLTCTEAIA